jgi:hypothetical protein
VKHILSLATAVVLASSLTTAAFANGQGTPIEPAPAPEVMPPAGPAPAAVQTSTQAGQNWWLIALAAAIAIGIIIAISDDDEDTTDGT